MILPRERRVSLEGIRGSVKGEEGSVLDGGLPTGGGTLPAR